MLSGNYRVSIARTAVNGNVCTHMWGLNKTEHVQFPRAAFYREVWWLVSISIQSVWVYSNCLFFVNNKVLYFCTLWTMHLPFGLLSHQQQQKAQQEQVAKQFYEWKQPHGWNSQKSTRTRWEWDHNTFTTSLHLVPFCQLCTLQNSPHAY